MASHLATAILAVLFPPAVGLAADAPAVRWTAKDQVAATVTLAAEPFRLQDVRLLEGPFRHAMELDRKYLLSLDPDRLLHSFRLAAGLPSNAKPYAGWMAPNHNSRGCMRTRRFRSSSAPPASMK